jgi:two-component system response regulator
MNAPEILLVEDSEDDVELTKRAIRQSELDLRLKIVRNGSEALSYLLNSGDRQRGREFLVLVMLDLELPEVSGHEVLRQLREDPRTRDLPIVMFSSSLDEQHIAESYRLGANSYVGKPVDYKEFAAAVKSMANYWLTWNRFPAPEEAA